MKIFKLLYKYYYDININHCIIFISLTKCVDNIKLTYYNKNIIKMIEELNVTSLFKKLFVTGLLACSLLASGNTVAFASHKTTTANGVELITKAQRTVETDGEIDTAIFGGFNNTFTGSEDTNPYNIEVDPFLYEIYEMYKLVGLAAKDSGKYTDQYPLHILLPNKNK